MKKQTGAIMLISATCIGSGMIALPMLLAKVGIIPSIILMMLLWSVIYYTSLANIELNLQAGEGMQLGNLARKFSGRLAEVIGTSSFKVLSYTLLSVYIYAGSSVLQKMLESWLKQEFLFNNVAQIYTIGALLLLMLPLRILDYVNRILFIGLLIVIALLMIGLIVTINWHNVPLFVSGFHDIANWKTIIPITFTAFGFQVIFHTLTKFCDNDSKMLKKAFFWGSLIPALIYITWTCTLLSTVYQNNNSFYQKMVGGSVEVGELIKVLSQIAEWSFVQIIIWWISLLAIITSVLGIGVGLDDYFYNIIKVRNSFIKKVISAILTIGPAYILAIIVPNAFVKLLSFAGMILVVIAILLPIYLLYVKKFDNLYYPILKLKSGYLISIFVGLVIIMCQFL